MDGERFASQRFHIKFHVAARYRHFGRQRLSALQIHTQNIQNALKLAQETYIAHTKHTQCTSDAPSKECSHKNPLKCT